MGGKKKKKMMYLTTKNAGAPHTVTASVFIQIGYLELVLTNLTDLVLEFDRHELRIYEEVAKVPPFRRKTLVLIGAQGVGRRSLKNKLMVSDPQRYGTTIPCECSHASCITFDVAALFENLLYFFIHIFSFFIISVSVYTAASLSPTVTSRKPKVDERDGQMYSFMSRSEMECDIKNGRFLEHGEYDGNLYGTKINSIHEVMETGKICILDVNPQVHPLTVFCSLLLFFLCLVLLLS